MYWWYWMWLESARVAVECSMVVPYRGGLDTRWLRQEEARAEYLLWELRADLEEYGVEGLVEEGRL